MKLITAFILLCTGHSVLAANESYRFDQTASTIGFSVHQFLGSTRGKFKKFEGKIEVDRQHPESSSVTARIDVGSVDTAIVKRDSHLKSAEFFNAEKYPEITFKSRRVKQTGPNEGDIIGDLTMHGVTRSVTLHVKLVSSPEDPKQTRWSVTTDPLKRSDFKLMFAPTAETMSGISQSVAVNIEIEATQAQ